MSVSTELQAHLNEGTTTLCRCWVVRRRDGRVLGFTDHDRDIRFAGLDFRADTGLTAQALQQTTGLSVDNAEAMGALSDAAITESDIAAGRYDGALVEAWLVNWTDLSERSLRFRGTIGEVQAGGGAFRAELRGLSETLNPARGRAYQSQCSAALGDASCALNLNDRAFTVVGHIVGVPAEQVFEVSGLGDYASGWFERGRIEMLSGAAEGLNGLVKLDVRGHGQSRITLWEELRADVLIGDRVRLISGCDKRFVTCQKKFSNALNFRGFPHIPGEDWMMAYPSRSSRNDGGSRK